MRRCWVYFRLLGLMPLIFPISPNFMVFYPFREIRCIVCSWFGPRYLYRHRSSHWYRWQKLIIVIFIRILVLLIGKSFLFFFWFFVIFNALAKLFLTFSSSWWKNLLVLLYNQFLMMIGLRWPSCSSSCHW